MVSALNMRGADRTENWANKTSKPSKQIRRRKKWIKHIKNHPQPKSTNTCFSFSEIHLQSHQAWPVFAFECFLFQRKCKVLLEHRADLLLASDPQRQLSAQSPAGALWRILWVVWNAFGAFSGASARHFFHYFFHVVLGSLGQPSRDDWRFSGIISL